MPLKQARVVNHRAAHREAMEGANRKGHETLARRHILEGRQSGSKSTRGKCWRFTGDAIEHAAKYSVDSHPDISPLIRFETSTESTIFMPCNLFTVQRD